MPRHRPRVRIRPLRPADEATIDAVFAGLSAASRRSRYLAPVDRLSPAMRTTLLAVDGERHVAVVAEVGRGRRRQPVGIARFVVTAPGRAEIAYEVVDAWQGRGVGTRLVRAIVTLAHRHGLRELEATVAHGNTASLALLRRVLPQVRMRDAGDALELTAALVVPDLDVTDLLADLDAGPALVAAR